MPTAAPKRRVFGTPDGFLRYPAKLRRCDATGEASFLLGTTGIGNDAAAVNDVAGPLFTQSEILRAKIEAEGGMEGDLLVASASHKQRWGMSWVVQCWPSHDVKTRTTLPKPQAARRIGVVPSQGLRPMRFLPSMWTWTPRIQLSRPAASPSER